MTFGYREGVSTLDIRMATDELDAAAIAERQQRLRDIYVRRAGAASPGGDYVSIAGQLIPIEYYKRHYQACVDAQKPGGPFEKYNFRMIDASATDLREPMDRARKRSSVHSGGKPGDDDGGGKHSRNGSISSTSTARSLGGGRGAASPTACKIETSFCGPKPMTGPSFDVAGIETVVASSAATPSGSLPSPRSSGYPRDGIGSGDANIPHQLPGNREQPEIVSLSGSEDLSERNLVEEINRRTGQFPLTKQDSYANAIYSSAASLQQRRLKKQGSYEAAVESGVLKQASIKRTKQIMQIRKQESYTRAIGGSFEDDHTGEERGLENQQRQQHVQQQRSIGSKMPRKQESYLMAVGEMSPEKEELGFKKVEQLNSSPPVHRIRKQDSYLKAVDGLSPEDELAPLPSNSRITIKKQDSYQRAVLGSSFGSSVSGGGDDNECSNTCGRGFVPTIRKQDSYQKAVLGSSFASSADNDSIDRPSNILLTRQEAVEKTSPRPSPRVSPKRAGPPKVATGVDKKGVVVKKQESYSKAIELGYPSYSSNNNNNSGVVDNRTTGTGRFTNYDDVLREFNEKGSLPTNRNFDHEQQRMDMKNEAEAAVAIQSAFKGYQTRKEICEIQTFYKQVSESDDNKPSIQSSSVTSAPRPTEPLSLKKRQDSYLQAVGLSPEEESKPSNRSWKIRQDSYQQAINIDSDEMVQQTNKPRRQDSYLQAIGSTFDPTNYGQKCYF